MSNTDFCDIPDCLREKLIVEAQSEGYSDDLQTGMGINKNDYLESSVEENIETADKDMVNENAEMVSRAAVNENAHELAEASANEIVREEMEEGGYDPVEVMARPGRRRKFKEPPCRSGKCARPSYPNYPYRPCLMGSFCRNPERGARPVPYYQAYPGMLRTQENLKDEIDMDKMRERYPKTARRIQEYVEEAADRMDYDGSIMFDEYPDQVHIDRIVNDIFNSVIRDEIKDEMEDGKCNAEEYNEIIKELIMIILFQQMLFKRCKNRKCKEWW